MSQDKIGARIICVHWQGKSYFVTLLQAVKWLKYNKLILKKGVTK